MTEAQVRHCNEQVVEAANALKNHLGEIQRLAEQGATPEEITKVCRDCQHDLANRLSSIYGRVYLATHPAP